MDSLSMPSVSKQARDNSANKKFLLPRKPARQPYPIIYRRLRRGSAAARIPGKQTKDYGNGQDNKEYGASSSTSHVVLNVKDINETATHGQGSTQRLEKGDFTWKAFTQFCLAETICRQEHRATLAVKLYGVQVSLLSALGSPFENLSASSRSNSQIPLSLGQASSRFLPAMIWTGMFIVCFVYTVIVVWSLAFRVPVISMLCLSLLYSLSLLVAAASGFSVICGTLKMHGILFSFLGVLWFVMLFVGLVMLVVLASWRCKK